MPRIKCSGDSKRRGRRYGWMPRFFYTSVACVPAGAWIYFPRSRGGFYEYPGRNPICHIVDVYRSTMKRQFDGSVLHTISLTLSDGYTYEYTPADKVLWRFR